MRHSIIQSFTFHAAHRLPWHTGRCANLHGHTYRFEVQLVGDLNDNGIILDFDALLPIVSRSILDKLDHSDLNERFENPTAELVAAWILRELERGLPAIQSVRLWETPEASALVER